MGLGNLRAELVQIDLGRLAVYRVIIRGNALDLAFHAAVKPFARRVITVSIKPHFPPNSITMLVIVMHSSTDNVATPSPQNSNAL